MAPEIALDHILFMLVGAGALLCFVDWLIGRQNQERLKERLRQWLDHIQKASFRALLCEDATLVRRFAYKWFGARWYSPKFLALVLIISLLCVWALINWVPFWEQSRATLIQILTIVPINVFFAWLSYLVTLRLLRWMEKSATLIAIVSIMVFDVVLAALFVFLTVDSFVFWSDIEFNFLFPPLHGTWTDDDWLQWHFWLIFQKELMSPLTPFMDPASHFWGHETASRIKFSPEGVILVPLLLVLISVLPTLAHTVIGSIFVLSKMFRPVVRPILSLILLRFIQSRQGVLTVLGIACGAVASIIAAWPQAVPPPSS